MGDSFTCGFGYNIFIGNNVSVNMNCTFIDCNKITIGNNVLIAPHVQIHTAAHPIELNERLTPDWEPESSAYFCRTFALPVTIGDGLLDWWRSYYPTGSDYRRRLCYWCW